ncbi:MAG: TetR/AcrR family transcriptional regulator [Deltaproteobacteria bacterium]|nr:TetR/AcrR family transcriptional regulator [Deltaproteobacteria bacterium]
MTEMEASEATLSTRTQRRRQRTQARIVEAAERLMREHGVEAVTVQDITEAADVGHGTFYLHFESKAEVLRPLIDRMAERIHARVDRVTGGKRDPALRLATGVRIALYAIASDPLWNWYVFRSGTPFRRLAEGMGTAPQEDMKRGVANGRFQVTNLRATWSFIDGALIGVLAAWNRSGMGDDAAEITAELVLRSLGVSTEEAARIAREPLELT